MGSDADEDIELASEELISSFLSAQASIKPIRYLWGRYAVEEGVGIRDPKEVPYAFLEHFLESHMQEAGAFDMRMAPAKAVNRLKDLRRRDIVAWKRICRDSAFGVRDPAFIPADVAR